MDKQKKKNIIKILLVVTIVGTLILQALFGPPKHKDLKEVYISKVLV